MGGATQQKSKRLCGHIYTAKAKWKIEQLPNNYRLGSQPIWVTDKNMCLGCFSCLNYLIIGQLSVLLS